MKSYFRYRQIPLYRTNITLTVSSTLALLSIVLSSIAFTGCGSKDAKAADTKTAGNPAQQPVAINTVENRVNPSEVSKITAIGRVEPEDQITALSMEVSGVVSKIAAEDGANLKAGAMILELDHSVESARLQLAEARVRTQGEEIKAIRAQIRSAEAKAENTRDRYHRLKNIFDNGAETRQNLDNAKTDMETAAREVERLQASLQSAESRLAELRADARVTSAEIGRKVLKAPSDGMLLKLSPNVGSAVAVGASVGDFAPKGAMTVLCEVDELFVTNVAVGQKANIRRQGSTETIAEGVVTAIGAYLKKKSLFSDEAGALEDRRVRDVRVRLGSAGNLLLNSRVECVIAVK